MGGSEPGSWRRERPLRVAIVGAGPAGFYTAAGLFKQDAVPVSVDLFERLPAPFGLVRYGVAPDHEKIKRVTAQYERTAADERFRFFGNVCLGQDLHVEDLRAHYDQIVYTVGAQTDRSLDIPGEALDGSCSATEFVAWYNGHPDFVDREFRLDHPTAVVIGAGNVALDVARILARTPEELATTDIADHALHALGESAVKDIYIFARRGPAQAKWTPSELKEFGELADAMPVLLRDEIELDKASEESIVDDRIASRNMDIKRALADLPPRDASRRVHFRFCWSPTEIFGSQGQVSGIHVVKNRLEPTSSGYIQAMATDRFEHIDCGLVMRSIGYRGEPLPGVPFDQRRGVIPNDGGRVTGQGGDVVAREYVAGWIKRGPSGVIGTNKGDAYDTVDRMMEDTGGLDAVADEAAAPAAIDALLAERKVKAVRWSDWRRIDAYEIAVGEPVGRPRVKLCRKEQLLALL